MSNASITEIREQHLQRNYEAFQRMTFPEDQTGRLALLRNQEVVEVFDYTQDAMERARELFKDGLFSIEEINPPPLRIGGGSLSPEEREISPERVQEIEREYQEILSGKSKLPEIKVSYRPHPGSNGA